jgi:uncharacterized membrane protein YgcG
MSSNAYRISALRVKVFIPTLGIGFARFQHHHLFIPGFERVWSKIIRLYEAVVNAWYQEISTCSSGIVLYQTAFHSRLPNAERFKFLHGFRLYSPAGNLIISYIYPKVRYKWEGNAEIEDDTTDTRTLNRTQYYIYGDESYNDRQITWDPFSQNHIIIGTVGSIRTKKDIFGCNGEIYTERSYNPEYIVRGWLKRSGNIYDMITSGVIMEIASGYNYVMYGLTSDPNQVFGTVWARIIQSLSSQLKLYYTDWGDMFLGVWDRWCGRDADPVVDWTNDARRYPGSRYQPDQPYLADISLSVSQNPISAPTISLCGGGSGEGSSGGSGGSGGSGSGGSGGRGEGGSSKGKEGGWNIWWLIIAGILSGLWFLRKARR